MEIQELEYPLERRGVFILGVLGSIIGAIIGAVAWCVITVVTDYEVGIIAWALGGLAGLGMVLGYGQRRVAAGVAAAVIAIVGIVGAKLLVVGYMGREDLSTIRQQIAAFDLPTEQYDQVIELAGTEANQQTRREGLCPFDDLFWQRYYKAVARHAALPEDELAEAVAEHKEWSRVGRFEDPEYVRYTLPYYLLWDARLGMWYRREPVAPEEWEKLYKNARAQAAALGPEEQHRECRRRAQAYEVAYLEAQRRTMEQQLAPDDDASALRLAKKAYAEALAMEDDVLAEAFAKAHAWDDEGQWNDVAWLRLRLTYIRARQAWREREAALPSVTPMPGGAWDECYQQAAAGVTDVPEEQLADRVRQEYDEESLAWRQQIKSEYQGATAAWVVANAASTFGLFDLLFAGLAVVTAYRVATSRKEGDDATAGDGHDQFDGQGQ